MTNHSTPDSRTWPQMPLPSGCSPAAFPSSHYRFGAPAQLKRTGGPAGGGGFPPVWWRGVPGASQANGVAKTVHSAESDRLLPM